MLLEVSINYYITEISFFFSRWNYNNIWCLNELKYSDIYYKEIMYLVGKSSVGSLHYP